MKQLQNILRWIYRSLFTRNKGDLKVVLLCLFVAGLFWFLNAMNHDYTTNLSYPIAFKYDTEEYISVSDLPTKVTFNATGHGWDLFKRSFGISVEPVTINLENLPERKFILVKQLFPVFSEQVKGIDVNYMVGDTIYLNFDYKYSRVIQLELKEIDVPLGDQLALKGDVSIKPDTIVVTGPKKMIMALDSVVELKLDEKSITGNYEDEVRVNIERSDLVNLNLEEVLVSFDVEPTRIISLELPVVIQNLPDDFSTRNYKALLTLEVPTSKAEGFDKSNTVLTADFSSLSVDSLLTIQFEGNEFVEGYTITPLQIDLKDVR